MDRSFLSHAKVVAASRSFVCIRLATYEDKQEAAFMKSLYVGRSGELENTTFAILSPDGKRKLTRAGRGPMHAFRGGADMAAGMDRIAARFPKAKKNALSDPQLPLMKNLDLGLNVASCDGLPLIVTVAKDAAGVAKLNKKLIPLAWEKSLAGQFAFANATREQQLKPITGLKKKSGIIVVSPGQFGLSGKVLAEFEGTESVAAMQKKLTEIVAKFPRARKDHNSHVRFGIQMGVDWKSQIPETDPMSIQAKKRIRGN